MFGRFVLLVAILIVLHAAFSTYEHLSHLKALGKPEGFLPQDIVLEAIVGLALGVLGASLNAPALKGITWASEMRKRSIDEMDSRTGFGSFVNRGRRILSPTAPSM
ncbi:hypothetical protein Moror_7024 [Moniliophthora roreri MCA 2997]|uniref:Magnesium transporter n=2 Tax=Moniliophthora roreri TaxID=221103 RepID=V2XUI0_MONRO|nr:hypothetical protein Moror_7024 [Moniliophthora roreri MCA 2997]KAI3619977.1 hypothetical protein WG66_002879 [Moniliophthora roreri]